MTIARRLILLVAVPFFILLAIWAVTRGQMIRVEERIRFTSVSPGLKVWIQQTPARPGSAPAR